MLLHTKKFLRLQLLFQDRKSDWAIFEDLHACLLHPDFPFWASSHPCDVFIFSISAILLYSILVFYLISLRQKFIHTQVLL